MSGLPPTRRVERRKGHSYLLDGEPCSGVTSILDNGVPKGALVGWAAKVTAEAAVDRWEELAEMKTSERLATLKAVRWEVRDHAARRGTEVHDLALRHSLGDDVSVPEELEGHFRAYERYLEEWKPREILVEVVVGKRGRWPYMGTLDAIADLEDGNRWLLDFKTNAKGPYPETALQLAAYRFADFYLDADAEEKPLPEVDRVGVLWLHPEGYELIPVEAGEPQFRTFLYAMQIARFVEQPREVVFGDPLRAARPEGVMPV